MFSPRNIRGVVISGVAVVAALTLTAGQSAAESGCFTVSGRYTEHAVTGPECRSPAGLCIAGTYRGDISGSLRGSATTVTPTADTPNTSVLTFTSDSTITGAVKGNRGTLVVKNAGVFNPAGRFHRGSSDHRRWNRQTRRGAWVCPGQRNVLRRERRNLGVRRFSVRGMTPSLWACPANWFAVTTAR